MRLLIVDDCHDAADSLAMLTQIWGYDAVAVYDGASALDRMPVELPDVMLVDLGMPGVDGNRVAREVRSRGASRPTLVAVSGYGDLAHRRAATEAGFDHYILKPIDPPAFRHFLCSVTESLRLARQARVSCA